MTITFGQLIEKKVRNIFSSKNNVKNDNGRLVPDVFLFF